MNKDSKEAKRFGVILTIIFFVIGIVIPIIKRGAIHLWLVYLAGLIFISAVFFTKFFIPIFKFWMKFTQLIAKIISAVILGVFFYFIITPVGLVMKCFGRDALSRKWNKDANTYWVRRESSLNDPKRIERQF
ncbi:MAG: hypothetical protein FJZ11_02560 [Candidatus Omnitrophica bacterium]|nr:hypothetical protein [Candidatus Omnitrophota bacterium]